MVHLKIEPELGAGDWTLALQALLEFGLKANLAGYRPGCLEVGDEALGLRLWDALQDRELGVVAAPGLAAVKEVLAAMGEQLAGRPLPPDALATPGVTVERMRAFAEAARRFYEAAPWRHLTDEDLICVEAPAMRPGLGHFTVLGAGGVVVGLGFYESAEEHERLLEGASQDSALERPGWSVLFGRIDEMPFGDVDLWEDHGLPVAGEDAYPVAIRCGGDEVRRPDARVLAFLEGLLRALAETTEGEIDGGRWAREVPTAEGRTRYQLAIPSLLEPLDAPVAPRGGLPDPRAVERVLAEAERFMAQSAFETPEQAQKALEARFRGPLETLPSTASTPLERAQDLAYRAASARGRRRIQLARKALEISGDCADAYVLLAEDAPDPERACQLYAEAAAAGERALGPRVFAEEAGHFWGMVATRPYMRARYGLAEGLEGLGRRDEAMAHYRELLRLNPNDNQGVRYLLLPALLAAGRDAEAGALLDQYGEDPMAVWHYGRALSMFRREGDSAAAGKQLRQAVRANRHVPAFLRGREELPDEDPPSYAFGSREEAVICARLLVDAWRASPGAARWLLEARPRQKARKKAARR